MKISGYYIYNNVAITAFAIMSMLSVSPRIPLSKVALLMPILLDDNITQKMTYQNYNSFDSVVTQNQVYLSNFNDRYIDLLSQVVNGISILLDLNLVSLYGEFVIAENAASYESILSKCDSKRFVCIQTAASKLLKTVEAVEEYAKEFEPHAPIEWIRKWRSSKEDCKGMAENILKKWV